MSLRNIPLLDYVAENLHHAFRLLFCEPLILQPLHEFERVKVVVFALRCGSTKLTPCLHSS